MINELDKLGIKHNTDKASTRINQSGKTVRGHNYLETYECFLKEYREEEITLVELGVGSSWNCGKSLLRNEDKIKYKSYRVKVKSESSTRKREN